MTSWVTLLPILTHQFIGGIALSIDSDATEAGIITEVKLSDAGIVVGVAKTWRKAHRCAPWLPERANPGAFVISPFVPGRMENGQVLASPREFMGQIRLMPKQDPRCQELRAALHAPVADTRNSA